VVCARRSASGSANAELTAALLPAQPREFLDGLPANGDVPPLASDVDVGGRALNVSPRLLH
jgi:hypothetical protein